MRLRSMFPAGLCGAKTRKGTPCAMVDVYICRNGKLRCKFHGGKSTGPKTKKGKERALKAMQEGWKRWKAALAAGRKTKL